MRTLAVLFLTASLHATPFTSASVEFPYGCPSGETGQTVTGTTTASVSTMCAARSSGGDASAAEGHVSAESQKEWSVVTAESQYGGTAPLGWSVFAFHLSGIMWEDGASSVVTITVSTDGGSDSMTLGAHRYTPVDCVFVSKPLMVTDGTYTVNLKATAMGIGSGEGVANVWAEMLGGEEVPEPVTWLLAAPALLAIASSVRP